MLYGAIHKRGDKLSVAMSAAQIEALCQLKRDLIANGVPEGKIRLIHSYLRIASLHLRPRAKSVAPFFQESTHAAQQFP